MSWHGPSAPRVEGIATKSRVVASCASKPASTASRIFCLVSLAFIASHFPLLSFARTARAAIKPHFAGISRRFRSLSESRPRPYTARRKFAPSRRHTMPGNRNILFLIVGALIVVVAVLGYNLYQTKKQPEGLQINVGPNGLKIQNK